MADKQRRRHLFIGWLVLFYATWALLVPRWGSFAALVEHWEIAGAMALGSYFAGSIHSVAER